MSRLRREFRSRQLVEWVSQSHGHYTHKVGRIVLIVPRNKAPLSILDDSLGLGERALKAISTPWSSRPYDSYIVRVGDSYYWPHVGLLRRVDL